MNPGNLTKSLRAVYTHYCAPFCANLGALLCGLALLLVVLPGLAQTASSVAVPLLSPTSIAFDSSGVLYVVETGRHLVERLNASGGFTVVAGSGTQGFGGDGGAATAALLDSPRGLALDGAGNLFIADTRNHRVRMVAAGTGVIRTVAGTGLPGFSGDGAAAVGAQLAMPTAIALDGAGNLYVADSGNHRIRRVVLATGAISTVAGNGVQGFSGDAGPAVGAALDTPWGLAANAAGDVFLADLHNGRVRRVAHDTGTISTLAAGTGLRLPRGISVDAAGNVYAAETGGQRIVRVGTDGTAGVVAGTGVEGFAGDGGLATSALLDGPQGTGVSPGGLVTLADTRNQRVRQVDGAGVIRTLGGSVASSLALTGPATVQYGTGMVTATLASGSAAGGVVAFSEVVNGANVALGSGTFAGGTGAGGTGSANAVSFSTAGLGAGTHAIVASYGGDATHGAAVSNTLVSAVTPAPVAAHPVGASILYGQAVPGLTGSLTGVLARDVNAVSAVFASGARGLSPVGSYPIGATLVGASAGNYMVAVDAAAVTIAQAPTTTTVGVSASPVAFGGAVTMTAKAASTTLGTPTGRLTFLDGTAVLGAAVADAGGSGSVTTTTLGTGVHALSAVYAGDGNFLGSSSASVAEVIQAGTGPDFTLAAAGGSSQTVASGAAASFGFTVAVQNGPLNSPILLSASGTPSGATVSFSPAYVTPGGAGANVTLSIQTVKTVAAGRSGGGWVLLAVLVGLPWVGRRRLGRGLVFGMLALGLVGCGEKVTQLAPATSAGGASYPMVVTATSTLASGSTLQHTALVTLIVQ